jgi:homoprotocatechuate degradation regulator HpaR
MSNLRQTRRSLPIALLRAREKVMEPIREMLVASGVNEQKWRVLRILEEQGPMELSHLARDACLLLSSLTRMVRPLEDDGLVTRSTPPDDRRKSVLAITPSGVALIETHSAQSAAIFRQIEAAYGKDRLETLLDLLEDLQKIDLPGGKNG